MLNELKSVLTPSVEEIRENKYPIAIRGGLLLPMPLLIVGPFFLLITNFPVLGWTDFWVRLSGDNRTSYFSKPIDATFSTMAVLAVIGIGYSFAGRMNVDKLLGTAIAPANWFLTMPYETLVDGGSSVSEIPLNWVGSKGIFVGIIVAFLPVHIYVWVNKKGWIIKTPDGVLPTVAESFPALIPADISILVLFIMDIVLAMTLYKSAFNFIFIILQAPLLRLDNTLPTMVTAYIFLHLFWFFGVNGGFVVGAAFSPILQAPLTDSPAAFRAGQTLPNVISQRFQDLFVTFGGCGSTLSLLIVMFLLCRSKCIGELGRLALILGVFGTNEPIVLGLPIVLNLMILTFFMLAPIVNIVISYLCMSIGPIPICTDVAIPWTMPMVLPGLLAIGWQGTVLQLLLLMLRVSIYMPFIKMMDKQYLEDETKASEKSDDDDFDFDDLSFGDLWDGCP